MAATWYMSNRVKGVVGKTDHGSHGERLSNPPSSFNKTVDTISPAHGSVSKRDTSEGH